MKRVVTGEAKQEEKEEEEHRVRVDKLPHRMSGKKWPVLEGFHRVNCTSGAPGVWSQLSPMKLGPVQVSEWGWRNEPDIGETRYGVMMPPSATNVENLWQASKVWKGEEDAEGVPIKEFFRRRRDVWNDPKAHRWIKKGDDESGNKNVPLYSLWGTKKLSYIEARKRIYCPIYAALVKQTEAYRRLEAMVKEGKNVLLLEYDGYDRGSKSLVECLNDPSRPFGHSLVLECLLTGVEPWKQEDGPEPAKEERVLSEYEAKRAKSTPQRSLLEFFAAPKSDACCFCKERPGIHQEYQWRDSAQENRPAGLSCDECRKKNLSFDDTD